MILDEAGTVEQVQIVRLRLAKRRLHPAALQPRMVEHAPESTAATPGISISRTTMRQAFCRNSSSCSTNGTAKSNAIGRTSGRTALNSHT